MEIWKPIKLSENYQISNLGRCKSISRLITEKSGKSYYTSEKIMKDRITHNGYNQFCLRINGRYIYVYAHRLVAEAFLGSVEGFEINHKDGNKTNNHMLNLEIVCKEENIKHAKVNRLFKNGQEHGHTFLTNKSVLEIKKLLKDGLTNRQIADIYGIKIKHVWEIKTGRTWKYLEGELNETK